MAHVEVSALSKTQKDELSCTYAALLLHDGELEITEEKLNKVLTASGNSVEGYWPGLFAKALRGKDVGALLSNAGSASAGPAPAASGAPAAAAAPAKKEEPKSKSYFKLMCLISTLNVYFTSIFLILISCTGECHRLIEFNSLIEYIILT